jgi:hypothetical protein
LHTCILARLVGEVGAHRGQLDARRQAVESELGSRADPGE